MLTVVTERLFEGHRQSVTSAKQRRYLEDGTTQCDCVVRRAVVAETGSSHWHVAVYTSHFG